MGRGAQTIRALRWNKREEAGGQQPCVENEAVGSQATSHCAATARTGSGAAAADQGEGGGSRAEAAIWSYSGQGQGREGNTAAAAWLGEVAEVSGACHWAGIGAAMRTGIGEGESDRSSQETR